MGERKQAHYIVTDRCLGCGACIDICPQKAIFECVKRSPEEEPSGKSGLMAADTDPLLLNRTLYSQERKNHDQHK